MTRPARSLRGAAATLLLLAGGLAAAQPAAGVRCPGGASAPTAADCPMGGPMHEGGAGGMGAGMGPGAMHDGSGRMPRHMRMGEDDTPGWSMMSAAERRQHRDRLRSMKSRADCEAYMAEHHAQMQARAQAQGRSLPARPRRDACAWLKPAKP